MMYRACTTYTQSVAIIKAVTYLTSACVREKARFVSNSVFEVPCCDHQMGEYFMRVYSGCIAGGGALGLDRVSTALEGDPRRWPDATLGRGGQLVLLHVKVVRQSPFHFPCLFKTLFRQYTINTADNGVRLFRLHAKAKLLYFKVCR